MESASNRWPPQPPLPERSAASRIVGYSRSVRGGPAAAGEAAPVSVGLDLPSGLPIPGDRDPVTGGFVPLAKVVRRNRTEVLNILLGGSLLQRNPIGDLASLDYQLSVFALPVATFAVLTRITRRHAKAS